MRALQAKTSRSHKNSCSLEELKAEFDQLLTPQQFKDYCPNGLQVEGRSRIKKLVSGVTASLELLDQAIAAKADAIVVHHGYFFKGEDERVIGQKKMRLARLLKADVSLFAFHIPLDAHPELGNNVQLGAQLGWPVSGYFGDNRHGAQLGVFHDLSKPVTASTVLKRIALTLQREPLLVGDATRRVDRIAWCTGAAQDMLQEAIDAGAQLFVSGEVSERTTHLAREMGVAYIAAGHHATERYGVQALGEAVAQTLGLAHQFIDIANPV